MPLPRIDTLLATDSEMQPILAKAREINALAKLCKEFLPPELAAQLLPANLQGDKLVILAANSSAAAKLKLLSGSLSDFLAKRGAKVNSVSVKVQPAESAASEAIEPRSKRVSEQAFAVLSELYSSLGDSPARQALHRLLEGETKARRRAKRPRR
ncbi:MAG TPA: DciA family protein [Burkholderiales bacterium]|jgi:hypothetical protein|nr:DciA family protein [Burkholderiales bacterium]